MSQELAHVGGRVRGHHEGVEEPLGEVWQGGGQSLGRLSRARVVQLPRVLLQVEVATEALAADPAGERLLLVVCVHVERQVVDLVERLQTDMISGSDATLHLHYLTSLLYIQAAGITPLFDRQRQSTDLGGRVYE